MQKIVVKGLKGSSKMQVASRKVVRKGYSLSKLRFKK
jgi:hypothetical protein